jgi:hypothetical protein
MQPPQVELPVSSGLERESDAPAPDGASEPTPPYVGLQYTFQTAAEQLAAAFPTLRSATSLSARIAGDDRYCLVTVLLRDAHELLCQLAAEAARG